MGISSSGSTRCSSRSPRGRWRPSRNRPPLDQLPGLLAGVAWDTLLDGALRRYVEREALVGFCSASDGWVCGPARIATARFADWALVRAGAHPVFLTLIEAKLAASGADGSGVHRYFVPLAAVSNDEASRIAAEAPSAVLARITGARKGLLVDAAWDDHASALLLDAVAAGRELIAQEGTVRARRGAAYLADEPSQLVPVERAGLAQRHTALRFGTRKNPAEFPSARPWRLARSRDGAAPRSARVRSPASALRVGFRYAPVAHREGATLAMVQGLVRNQGDAWSWMLDEVGRFFERATGGGRAPALDEGRGWRTGRDPLPPQASDPIGIPLVAAATIGRRTAEMHRLLARETDDGAFAPEPLAPADVARLVPR